MQAYRFRGKKIDGSGWAYGSLVTGGLFGESLDKFWIFVYGIGVFHEVIPETVGMWTGLKDKNDIDIYEGDILKGWMGEQGRIYRSPIESTVVFKEGGFEVFAKPMTRCTVGEFLWCDHGSHGRDDVYYIIEDIAVQGNIHDKVKNADRTA